MPISYTDARNPTFNEVGGDQVNMVFGGQDSLDKLKPVAMDASRRTGCLQGTRRDILKIILDWVHDPHSQQNILWLHGLAGSGKSALSTTIASILGSSGQLGAFLFFDRDVTDRSDPTAVIRTLAHQLGSSSPKIGATLRAVVERNSNILASSIHLQFQKLLLDPLSIGNPTASIVIVLDALDECGTADERETLLEILANDFRNLPYHVRTIITSRSDIGICNAFESQYHILAFELDITSSANSDDILSFFRYRMSLIRNKKRHMRLEMGWPGEDVLHTLVQRASGLFVWASTASGFINAHDPKRRLDLVLRGDVASGAEGALDALYKTALESIGLWDDEDFVSDFRAIIGMILVARQPLSSSAIDALLLLPEHRPSMHTISLLRCVLQQDRTVRVLHPSFADFLMTQERCGRDFWSFDRYTYHRYLAIRCMDCMDAVLQRNMCNMTLTVDQANEKLPEEVSYSCLFWIDHICVIKDGLPIMDRLRDFLYRHLLHWFEAMSILKRSRNTIPLLDELRDWISSQSRPSVDTRPLELVRDACRFARVFARTIEEHPLLVYMSALPFTPTTSPLYQTFHDVDLYPIISGGFQYAWSPLLLVMEHADEVNSVSFSPDGTQIVSGSDDKTIRVWNSITGAEISEMRGHKKFIWSVNFSPDGNRIVSGSFDRTVRVWDSMTGAEVLSTKRGPKAAVGPVAFSLDGSMILSATYDKTVRTWNAVTGTEISVMRGSAAVLTSLAFSADAKKIVSSSKDKTIRVWDAATGAEVSAMQGHEDLITSVRFSLDGCQIVSGSADKTIRVWDAATGTEIIPAMRKHSNAVQSVAFSPNGERIVSGSSDTTICIWNSATGAEISELRGHAKAVLSVNFSPDGKRIVSGSQDCTIRIWDAMPGARVLPIARGQIGGVCSVAFSPDGAKTVSGSKDGAIRLWDSRTGVQIREMRGHEDEIWSVNFSPDGGRIISGSWDTTVRVWDATTGAQVFPELRDHTAEAKSEGFSLDASHSLAKSYFEGMVWATKIGHRLRSIKEPNHLSSQSIRIIGGGWVVDSISGRTLGKLPAMISKRCDASHERSLAVGTDHGQIILMHFPPALMVSPDTRMVEGNERSLGSWKEEGVLSEEDSDSD